MSGDFSFEIRVPCDEDGFVLLQCPRCGELFKLRPDDFEADDVVEVCCPSCGIASENFLTKDVIELALSMARNRASSMLYGEMKKLERSTRGKPVSFKAGDPPKLAADPELRITLDAFAIVTCRSCHKQVKISQLLKMSAYSCPLCGVINFMAGNASFQKTLHLFKHESNVLFRSDWEESPAPFKRFLSSIEKESAIKSYLDDCVENHTPEGFSASDDVRAVAGEIGAAFCNFSTVPEEESAEVYLILKEMIAQDIKGRSDFYYPYGGGSKKYADMYEGFLDKVVRRLVSNIDEHLVFMGIDMGLGDGGAVTTNINGTVQNMQINQPTGGSAVNAVQKNGMDASQVDDLLEALVKAAGAELSDQEQIAEIRDNVDALREQLASEKPKRGIIKSAMAFLHGVNGGTQFAAALAQIIDFLARAGFQLPF